MSPVNRARWVSETSPHHSLTFVRSYEKPDWPGYHRDLGNRDENFPYEHSTPGNRDEFFLDKIASRSQHSGDNGIIFVLYFHFRSMRKS